MFVPKQLDGANIVRIYTKSKHYNASGRKYPHYILTSSIRYIQTDLDFLQVENYDY